MWLGEVITDGASADLFIPSATSDSVSTLVSLLYGGSPTVTHRVFAGLQSLCHSLGLKFWLRDMIIAVEEEEETTAATDSVQPQLQPSDEDAINQQGQISAKYDACSTPAMVASVKGALKETLIRRPTKSGINALDEDEQFGEVKGCNRRVGFKIVESTDLKMTVVKEKPKRSLRSSNEKTLSSIARANVKKLPNEKRKSSRTRTKQNFACELCSATSTSSQMLQTHYNRIHFNNLTRGNGRGGSLSTSRVRKEEDCNVNKKAQVEASRCTTRSKRHKTLDGIRSLRRNLVAQVGAKASRTSSVLTKEKEKYVGVGENIGISEISRGEKSRKQSRVDIGRDRSVTSRRITPPTTSSSSSVGSMKVVVPATEGKSTSSTSSMVSTGDKKAAYFSMWTEAVSDKVLGRGKFIEIYFIAKESKEGPLSATVDLSSTFSKFISARANVIKAQGLQTQVDSNASTPFVR